MRTSRCRYRMGWFATCKDAEANEFGLQNANDPAAPTATSSPW